MTEFWRGFITAIVVLLLLEVAGIVYVLMKMIEVASKEAKKR